MAPTGGLAEVNSLKKTVEEQKKLIEDTKTEGDKREKLLAELQEQVNKQVGELRRDRQTPSYSIGQTHHPVAVVVASV